MMKVVVYHEGGGIWIHRVGWFQVRLWDHYGGQRCFPCVFTGVSHDRECESSCTRKVSCESCLVFHRRFHVNVNVNELVFFGPGLRELVS